MSPFTKTVVIKGGVSRQDAEAIADALKEMSLAIAERLRDHDKEIAELKSEIERLKREPHQSLAQKIRARNQ